MWRGTQEPKGTMNGLYWIGHMTYDMFYRILRAILRASTITQPCVHS